MTDVIVIAIVLVIIAGAAGYVIKMRKSGKKCIGCPESGCSGKCSCCLSQLKEEENDG